MKLFLLRLDKQNIYFIIAIFSAILLFITVNQQQWYLIVFVFLTLLFLLQKPAYLLLFLVVSTLAFLFSAMHNEKSYWGYISHRRFIVLSSDSSGVVIKYDGALIKLMTEKDVLPHDVIEVSGRVVRPNHNYFSWQHIHALIFRPKIKILSHANTVKFQGYMFFKDHFKNYQFLSNIFLGIKQKSAFYELATKMNISFLFVISGFHFALIYLATYKALKLIKINEITLFWATSLLIIIYLIIIGATVSSTRAVCMIIFFNINKLFLKNKFTRFELFGFILLLFFLYDPMSTLSISFQFSFAAVFVILVLKSYQLPKWKFRVMVPIIIDCLLIPLKIYYFGAINLVSPFFSLVFGFIFPLIYFLSALLVLWPSWADFIIEQFIGLMHLFSKLSLIVKIDDPLYKNIFVNTYVLLPITFIIYKIWFWYTEKKNT